MLQPYWFKTKGFATQVSHWEAPEWTLKGAKTKDLFSSYHHSYGMIRVHQGWELEMVFCCWQDEKEALFPLKGSGLFSSEMKNYLISRASGKNELTVRVERQTVDFSCVCVYCVGCFVTAGLTSVPSINKWHASSSSSSSHNYKNN
jgi:hypothetical protein